MQQPKPAPIQECPKTIELVPQLTPIPAEYIRLHPNLSVPSAGDNAALLEWAMQCASNNEMYERQVKALKELDNELE